MTYGLTDAPSGLTITLSAKTREELYKDAAKAALEAAYGPGVNEPATDGQTYPVQGAGRTEAEILRTFVAECLEAARRAEGTLLPPRWLSFDEGRVTANLVLAPKRTSVRDLEPAVTGAFASEGSFPDFRATLAFGEASH